MHWAWCAAAGGSSVRKGLFLCLAVWLAVSAISRHPLAARDETPAAVRAPREAAAAIQPERALLDRYCVTCHNQRARTAGLTLDTEDITNPPAGAAVWEKVIRKVRGGLMPPVGMPRPDRTALAGLASFLETSIDGAAKPAPGRTVLHRLNRAEYGNAIRDLLGLDVDVQSLLPPDDSAYGFDNIGDALGVSPVLMERYLSAAWKIAALSVGDPKIAATKETFRVRGDLSQDDHIEGLPIGTRGGTLVRYTFPFDGERVLLARFGGREDEQANYLSPTAAGDELEKRFQKRIAVKAGPHDVGVAFVKKSSAPTVDLLQPFLRERIDPITPVGIPDLDKVTIEGPFNVTGPGDSPSRRRIFVCPTAH